MIIDPKILAIAHALGAEMERQAYTHYRPNPETEGELRCVLVDGDLDLIALAQVAINEAAKQ